MSDLQKKVDELTPHLDQLMWLIEQVPNDEHYQALAEATGRLMEQVWEKDRAAQAALAATQEQRDAALTEFNALKDAIENWTDGKNELIRQLVEAVAVDVSGETVEEIDDNAATNLVNIAGLGLNDWSWAYALAEALTAGDDFMLSDLVSDEDTRKQVLRVLESFTDGLRRMGEEEESWMARYVGDDEE